MNLFCNELVLWQRKEIGVIGSGLIGSVIARELAKDKDFSVCVCDLSTESLECIAASASLSTKILDVTNTQELEKFLKSQDLFVNAIPGHLGFAPLKRAIELGIDTVDIAFYPEDPLALGDLATKNNTRVLVDFGVAPGLSNLFIGKSYAELSTTKEAIIYVGGLPKNPREPFLYTSVFSPLDVIELYTREARYLEDGKLKSKPALTEREMLSFKEIGELEAFLTDGVRSPFLYPYNPYPSRKNASLSGPR